MGSKVSTMIAISSKGRVAPVSVHLWVWLESMVSLGWGIQDQEGAWDREFSVLKPRKSCSNWDELVTLGAANRCIAQSTKSKEIKEGWSRD